MQSDSEIVKERIDIVDFIGQKVQLRSAGRNFKGLCPFHQEKSPSFMVNPDLQIYKCFGCGKGGDVFNFIEEFEGVDFREALQLAADHIGYELKATGGGDDKSKQEREAIYTANKLATEYWHYILMQHGAGRSGRDYMTKRGIRQEEASKFKLGYAPKGTNLLPYLVKKGYTEENLVKWGLAVDRNGKIYDKFRDRLILPIYNLKGQVVGFSGRIIEHSDYAPKYLNSSETPVYHKSEILMGLFQAKDTARQQKVLILQEGNLDLLASHKVGVDYIAATGGTAVTEQQLKLVKRYADMVLFCFDTDNAGQKALINAIAIAEKINLQHKVIELGKYKDPDELIQAEPETWQASVENAVNSLEYLFKTYSKDLDLGSADGKSNYARMLTPILATIKDTVQQQHFVRRLAMEVGVTAEMIMQRIEKDDGKTFPEKSAAKTSVQSPPPEEEVAEAEVKPDTPSRRELYLLALLAATDKFSEIEPKLDTDFFMNSANQELFDIVKLQKKTNKSYHELSEQLSTTANEHLQTILTWDLEDLINEGQVYEELLRLITLLEQARLRRKILDLRLALKNNPEDEKLLESLLSLSNKLQQLS